MADSKTTPPVAQAKVYRFYSERLTRVLIPAIKPSDVELYGEFIDGYFLTADKEIADRLIATTKTVKFPGFMLEDN